MTHEELIQRAEALVPLFKASAREAESARRPLDHVIEALVESDLFALMVPKALGGHELDLDTFFEVSLILSKADPAMGWLTAFYIEHNYWILHYPPHVVEEVFDGRNYALAPATLNIGGGKAEPVEGGYRISGQWAWATGITHATWAMAGGLVLGEDGTPRPTFFLMPMSDVEPVDTWHTAGMRATGSLDFKLDNVFVPEERVLPFIDFIYVATGIDKRFDGPLYRTPLMPVLGITAALPILGAAQMALEGFCDITKTKLESNTGRGGYAPKDMSVVIGTAALDIETAEQILRTVLRDVMAARNEASVDDRSRWMSRIAHAVYMCRDAVDAIAKETGASGGMLDHPVQRAVRDISMAANHIVFAPENRYGDFGRQLLGQDIVNVTV